MRKIERLMNDAISNKVDFKSANTEVIYYTGNDISDVFLHGNLIARVYAHSIELMDGGYQSNTTKSRINAILKVHGLPGEYVFQKNFQWFVNFQGAPIPFFSGMRLN
jgi:hypothetical protein